LLRRLLDDAHRAAHIEPGPARNRATYLAHVFVDEERRPDDAELRRFAHAHSLQTRVRANVDEALAPLALGRRGHFLVQDLARALDCQVDLFAGVRRDGLLQLLPVVHRCGVHLEDAVVGLDAGDLRGPGVDVNLHARLIRYFFAADEKPEEDEHGR